MIFGSYSNGWGDWGRIPTLRPRSLEILSFFLLVLFTVILWIFVLRIDVSNLTFLGRERCLHPFSWGFWLSLRWDQQCFQYVHHFPTHDSRCSKPCLIASDQIKECITTNRLYLYHSPPINVCSSTRNISLRSLRFALTLLMQSNPSRSEARTLSIQWLGTASSSSASHTSPEVKVDIRQA